MKLLKWTFQYWKLSDLKPHPLNSIFSDRTEAEIQELADDLAARGQQHPIDTLPDGTIVGGHQRVLAAQRNEWATIRCRVRYDLERAGADAVEQYLLRDNFNRRQLNPLEQARIYRRLKVLAKEAGKRGKGDVRDYIAKRSNKSGRTLDRWAHLLDAPIEVQNAVIGGKLKLLDGCRVVDLPAEVQANIARRIQGGQDSYQVVKGYLGRKKTSPVNVGTLLSRFVRDLNRHIEPLNARVDELESCQWATSLSTLQDAHKLIGRLCERIRVVTAGSQIDGIVNGYTAKAKNVNRR